MSDKIPVSYVYIPETSVHHSSILTPLAARHLHPDPVPKSFSFYLNDAGLADNFIHSFSCPEKQTRVSFSATVVPRFIVIQLIVGDGVVFFGFIDGISPVAVFRVVFRMFPAYGSKWCCVAAVWGLGVDDGSCGRGAGFDSFDGLCFGDEKRRGACGNSFEDFDCV